MTTAELLARFSRRTSATRFIPEIDGLRFLSIALVLLFHVTVVVGLLQHTRTIRGPFGSISPPTEAQGLVLRLLEQGGFGVDIFFVVSGFVLALPFISARVLGGKVVNLRYYFARRVTRNQHRASSTELTGRCEYVCPHWQGVHAFDELFPSGAASS
jgi:peptidoglycan/LPS O-acetylase OafA/YrhL